MNIQWSSEGLSEYHEETLMFGVCFGAWTLGRRYLWLCQRWHLEHLPMSWRWSTSLVRGDYSLALSRIWQSSVSAQREAVGCLFSGATGSISLEQDLFIYLRWFLSSSLSDYDTAERQAAAHWPLLAGLLMAISKSLLICCASFYS